MTTDSVSLDFVARQAKLTMEEMRLVREDVRLVRKDMADIMRLHTASYELTRRVERRQGDRASFVTTSS
ncbi:hypothetical protein [Hoeflea sp.]|uniref:hypothetical protein n=1 Tax=Hoeflea sp. TaxID=1940281 RepID=UPI0019A342CA|nr:hypothetical protein [Hoeflea sp.]MBC7283225.1 hypothetical protein [Hoeflea sp.]